MPIPVERDTAKWIVMDYLISCVGKRPKLFDVDAMLEM